MLHTAETEGDSSLLWEKRYGDLVKWRRLHGNCNVPKAEGKLGRWVVRQRELQKKGKLEKGRKGLLDKLEFVWNTNEAAWETKFVQLKEYARKHGHCCVPISDPVLGMWVAKMRANRRRGKLQEHRIKKLDQMDFVWNTAEADWMDKYDKLLSFRDREGHACVPFNEGELGWWVNTQRQSKRKGKLSKSRQNMLDEAGFIWNPQEFLAARRREAATAKARAAASFPSQHSSLKKRRLNGSTSCDKPIVGSRILSPSPKRVKRMLSPGHLRPLHELSNYPNLGTPSGLLQTQNANFLSEGGLGTPLSNAAGSTQVVGAFQYSPNGESNLTLPSERVDVQSIASLLSPSTSPAPIRNEMGGLVPIRSFVSFHGERSASGFMGARRKQEGFDFVLPPISSLKVLTDLSPH